MDDGCCGLSRGHVVVVAPPARMRGRRAALATASALLAAGLLPACSSPLNRGRLLGGEVALDAIVPEAPLREREWQPISIVSLDRSNWEEMRVLVPLDTTEHQPTYTQHVHLAWDTPRQVGQYPAAETALDTPTTDMLDEQALEMLLAPASALFDVAMFLPRAIAGTISDDEWGGHPWETVGSPLEPYARAPGAFVPAAPPGDELEEEDDAVRPGRWPWEDVQPEPEPPARRRPQMEVGG